MKKLGFLLLILCLRFSASGQVNLVPNGGFETIDSCNLHYGSIFLNEITYWDSPTNGTPDAYNICTPAVTIPTNAFGYQYPHAGSGYAGAGFYETNANYTEYIQVELDTTLLAQHLYCASFYVNLGNKARIANNNIGMYFSANHTQTSSNNFLNLTPQINDTNIVSDTLGWTLISGQFVANGGERYLIIGNFYADSLADTIHLNSGYFTTISYYYIDDISVTDCTTIGISEINNQQSTIEISPNPATSEIKITSTNAVMKQAHIYTMMGQCILQSTINNRQSTIDISSLPAGMYIAEVISEKGVIRKRFVKQ